MNMPARFRLTDDLVVLNSDQLFATVIPDLHSPVGRRDVEAVVQTFQQVQVREHVAQLAGFDYLGR